MSARTATRAALSLVVLAVTLALGAVLGVLASPTPDASAVQAVEVVEVVEVPAPVDPLASDPFLVALLGVGTDLPANAAELSEAADLVCEGFTAEVPLVVMADDLAAEFGLTDEEARHFANTAGVVRCSAP